MGAFANSEALGTAYHRVRPGYSNADTAESEKEVAELLMQNPAFFQRLRLTPREHFFGDALERLRKVRDRLLKQPMRARPTAAPAAAATAASHSRGKEPPNSINDPPKSARDAAKRVRILCSNPSRSRSQP